VQVVSIPHQVDMCRGGCCFMCKIASTNLLQAVHEARLCPSVAGLSQTCVSRAQHGKTTHWPDTHISTFKQQPMQATALVHTTQPSAPPPPRPSAHTGSEKTALKRSVQKLHLLQGHKKGLGLTCCCAASRLTNALR